MKNGATVAAFEREFAQYVGAKYAIALANGTCTLHTALVALGVKPGDKVATTPLTMAATSIAILQAGAVPEYVDVNCKDWLMGQGGKIGQASLPVSLYGLHGPAHGLRSVIDAAQTLQPKNHAAAFQSYSFQASKILALGEGGMLVTDSEELATKARSFSSLGYKLSADTPRIDSASLKSPSFERHHLAQSWNYRMNDLTAAEGLRMLGINVTNRVWPSPLDNRRADRCLAAKHYERAIEGCSWITPQYVPEGWTHDMWSWAVATDTPEQALALAAAIERHGGERPYFAWRITYQERAFRHLAPDGTCPIAENLQPRILAFQTNDLASAERNSRALKMAIPELDGVLVA